jgi:hypothetical protein
LIEFIVDEILVKPRSPRRLGDLRRPRTARAEPDSDGTTVAIRGGSVEVRSLGVTLLVNEIHRASAIS